MTSDRTSIRLLILALIGALSVLAWSPLTTRADSLHAPSGQQLFAQMNTAMLQAGSTHLAIRTITVATVPRTQTLKHDVRGSSDVSFTQRIEHSNITSSDTSLMTHRTLLRQRTEFIRVQLPQVWQ